MNGALKKTGKCTMDLLDSRNKPEFCDIKIQVFDGEIPVSKRILSIRSEYFRLMFSNNCVESSTGQVNMPYSKDVLEKSSTSTPGRWCLKTFNWGFCWTCWMFSG